MLFSQTAIAWSFQNLSFLHESRKFRERNSYNTENSCTEIMQNFGFSFRILHSISWIFGFSFAICFILGENKLSGKRHDMFVSWQNKFDWKCIHNYAEKYQVLSEQVHSQYFSGFKSIYMEGSELNIFNKLKSSTIPMANFHYRLSDSRYEDASTTATHLHIII